jgi:ribonuclease BN (tRNA processing enzyme)
MEIRSKEGNVVVVDAGSGMRNLGDKIAEEKVNAIDLFFTHAHWDHMMGLPFFSPLFKKGFSITIHGCPFTAPSYRHLLKDLMSAPHFPVELKEVAAKLRYDKVCAQPVRIGSMVITPIYISHPNGGLGFRFDENGVSFVFLTDNELQHIHPGGLSFEEYVSFSENADLLIHDAEFTPKDYHRNRSWGHSRYTDVVKLAVAAGVKRLGLFHLNQRKTDNDIDNMVEHAREMIAKKNRQIECFAVSNTFETTLE